ncbi:MAG: hypothetical protein ACOZCO_05835, partial [Bacteroidota bacterium]
MPPSEFTPACSVVHFFVDFAATFLFFVAFYLPSLLQGKRETINALFIRTDDVAVTAKWQGKLSSAIRSG